MYVNQPDRYFYQGGSRTGRITVAHPLINLNAQYRLKDIFAGYSLFHRFSFRLPTFGNFKPEMHKRLGVTSMFSLIQDWATMKTSTLCLGGRTYPSADSLPRWEDISISRQSVFDDSYRLIPTAGWMFVPLTPYHKAGAEIVFEPLVAALHRKRMGFGAIHGCRYVCRDNQLKSKCVSIKAILI